MIDLTNNNTQIQARINGLNNASSAVNILTVAIAAKKAELTGALFTRGNLDTQLQRVNNELGAASDIEYMILLATSAQGDNSLRPIGTVVENYLASNDPASPDWVKLGVNVTADTNIYPKLAGIQSPGTMSFTALAANNIPALLTNVTGTWNISCWKILNGVHVVIARDTANSVNYYRSFTSTDGVTFVERGNLNAAAAVTNSQCNLYYLNSKFYLVSTLGIYESANSGVTWSRKSSTYYYTMHYAFGMYIIGDTSSRIYTTTDFITYTLRFTASGSNPIVNFELLNGRLIAAMFTPATQLKYLHTTNGIDWTEAQITSYIDTSNISYWHVRVHNNKFVFIGDTRNFTLVSSDGINNWTLVPTVIAGSVGYDNGTIVAGDTLYSRNGFTTDISIAPRLSNSGTNQFCSDGTNIFTGNVGSTTLTLNKFPIANNASRVFLPALSNKMMKVK